MNLTLPDKFYKVFVLIGVVMMISSTYLYTTTTDKSFRILQIVDETDDSIHKEMIKADYEIKKIKRSDSLKSQVIPPNQIIKKLDSLSLAGELQGSALDYADKKYQKQNKILDTYLSAAKIFYCFGIIVFFVGAMFWIKDEYSNPHKNVVKQSEQLYPNCQSCGYKFSPMVGYGKNSDKTENYAFCYCCYNNGKFIEPDLTIKEVKERALEYMSESSSFKKAMAIGRIETLERWKKKKI